MQGPDYGYVDRLVHRLAFKGGPGARMLCDLETRLYGKRIADQPVDAPVFVTALPRAGTTLLLEILSRHPEAVTHTYRDMPFVMSPLMWRKLSGRFRVDLSRRERAHSDGMLVDADSPEAFEEVFWLRQFPTQYTDSGIRPWPARCEALATPLAGFIRRLLASRDPGAGAAGRYVSKNNANIARLPALKAAFGDAHVVIPLRRPLDHAASLHRQHLRFLDIHRESDFARTYMRDIGHFEFGALHRPILFDGMEAVVDAFDPEDLNYWLAYWVCAYRHLSGIDGAMIVDMQRFTDARPVAGLFDRLGMAAAPQAVAQASELIRPMTEYPDIGDVDASLAREADALFRRMRQASPF